MRKVILFMHVSLDGYVCDPNGEQDWMTMNDNDMDRYLINDLLHTVDTILVGRVLYQGFASFWPTISKNPSSTEELVEFANWMENVPKYVFSKSLDTVQWNNSTLVKGDIAKEIAKLKKLPGKDMVVFGGAGIVSTLTSQNLIDEYRIKLEPVILGSGKSLFADVKDRIRLNLIKSKNFDSGVVALYYEVDK